MSRKIEVIVACSAFLLFLTAAAQAREFQINQRFAGSAVVSRPEGVLLSLDAILSHKGGPGPASSRTVVLVGFPVPLSEQCAGFDFELPLLDGRGVATFADFSQLNFVITSGFICTNVQGTFAGTSTTTWEGTIVGGSGRFDGASGTLSVETHDKDVGPPPEIISSSTGTLTGTISVPN